MRFLHPPIRRFIRRHQRHWLVVKPRPLACLRTPTALAPSARSITERSPRVLRRAPPGTFSGRCRYAWRVAGALACPGLTRCQRCTGSFPAGVVNAVLRATGWANASAATLSRHTNGCRSLFSRFKNSHSLPQWQAAPAFSRSSALTQSAAPRVRLTLRWSRLAPAWHLARGARSVIIRLAGQAPFRRSRLSSNVRRHSPSPCATVPFVLRKLPEPGDRQVTDLARLHRYWKPRPLQKSDGADLITEA